MVLPDMMRGGGVEDVLAVEEGADAAWGGFDLLGGGWGKGGAARRREEVSEFFWEIGWQRGLRRIKLICFFLRHFDDLALCGRPSNSLMPFYSLQIAYSDHHGFLSSCDEGDDGGGITLALWIF